MQEGEQKHTVPEMETIIVPVKVPNSKPADIVSGIAGIASTCIHKKDLIILVSNDNKRRFFFSYAN